MAEPVFRNAVRRNLNRNYLLSLERAEQHESKVRALEARMKALSDEADTLKLEAAEQRQQMATFEQTLRLKWPDWTPEAARDELPYVSIHQPKDVNLRSDMIWVLRRARKPLSASEIVELIVKKRKQDLPDDPWLRNRLAASLSTMLRRAEGSGVSLASEKPKRWELLRAGAWSL